LLPYEEPPVYPTAEAAPVYVEQPYYVEEPFGRCPVFDIFFYAPVFKTIYLLPRFLFDVLVC